MTFTLTGIQNMKTVNSAYSKPCYSKICTSYSEQLFRSQTFPFYIPCKTILLQWTPDITNYLLKQKLSQVTNSYCKPMLVTSCFVRCKKSPTVKCLMMGHRVWLLSVSITSKMCSGLLTLLCRHGSGRIDVLYAEEGKIL